MKIVEIRSSSELRAWPQSSTIKMPRESASHCAFRSLVYSHQLRKNSEQAQLKQGQGRIQSLCPFARQGRMHVDSAA